MDDGFIKYGYQTWQEIDDETAAREEEIRVWSNHCEKRGFLQSFIDRREIDKPSNRLELLYYCPSRRKDGCCLILDFREYNRVLEEQRNWKEKTRFTACNCGNGKPENFQRCLQRKEYIEKYGEQYSKDLIARQKDQ